MKCGKCGTELPPNASFCPVCGNQMGANPGQMPPQSQFQPQSHFQPPQAPINTWLVPAILATIFCCLPFGIVSIIFASKANSSLSIGDFQQAQENASKAKTWFWVAFGCGLVSSVLAFLIQIIAAIAVAAD